MIRFFLLLLIILLSRPVLAQWTPMNGPDGGVITAIADAGGYLMCGSQDGYMFTSSDNGATWIPKGNVSGGLFRLATATGSVLAATSTGVYRSTDSGTSWSVVLNQFSKSVFATGPDALAATSNGLFRSSNAGATWTSITANLPDSNVYAAVFHGSSLFASVEDSAVYRSTNNGANWFPAWTSPIRRNIGFLVSDGTKLYAAPTGEARVFISSDNGASWTSSDLISGSTIFEGVFNLAVTPSGIYLPIAYQAGIFSFVNAGIFMSSNGSTWNLLSTGLVPRYVRSIMPVGSDLFAGTQGGGVFRSSNNGTAWSSSTRGIVKSHVTDLSFLNNGADFYAGVHGGGFAASSDSGHTWAARNAGLDATVFPIITEFVTKGTSWFIGTDGDGIFKTTNNGALWTPTSLGAGNSITGIAVRGTELMSTVNIVDGVFRSTDDGSFWAQIMSNFTTLSASCLTIGGAGTIFAGTLDNGILRSTNNGGTWLSSASLGGVPVFLRFIGTKMFAGTDNGPYRSTDFGVTWQASNIGLSGIGVNFIAIRDTNTLFASTNGSGVYVSFNGGASWAPINTGLPTLSTTSLRVTGSYVYCGTVFYGVWRRPLTDFLTDVRENDLTAPGEFALRQNYPNPFNPSTRIEYALPAQSHVSIKIYNLLGQEVASLVDEEQSGGHHATEWNGRSTNGLAMSSGVYFYRVEAKQKGGQLQFTSVRKMVLMK